MKPMKCSDQGCDRKKGHPGSHSPRCIAVLEGRFAGRCTEPAKHRGVHTTGYTGWGWADPVGDATVRCFP